MASWDGCDGSCASRVDAGGLARHLLLGRLPPAPVRDGARAPCGDRMTASKRRALRRLAGSERSPRGNGLALASAREERWSAATRRSGPRARCSAASPGAMRSALSRGVSGRPGGSAATPACPSPDRVRGATGHATTRARRRSPTRSQPLELAVRADAPQRVNLLVPDDRPEAPLRRLHREVQPGAPARRARAAGPPRHRGPDAAAAASWQRTVESYSGLAGLFDRSRSRSRARRAPLEVNPADRFIATTWWTAHLAHAALRRHDGDGSST